jgi:large repetitive protein
VMNDMITIQESPDANFIWEFVNEDPKSPSVRIIDESNNANSYEWTFSDGSHSQSPGTVVALKPQGKQIVALNVLNENGCTDGTVKQIAVNTDFKLDAPSEFTAGREVFMPLGLKQSKVNFTLSVYDQAGNKVFETSSRIKGWDGKIPGGTVAEEGSIYNWKVIITNDINKEQKYFNGSVKISP